MNKELERLSFHTDKEKMLDFKNLSKLEFLETYTYITSEEYDATMRVVKDQNNYVMLPIFVNGEYKYTMIVLKEDIEKIDYEIKQFNEGKTKYKDFDDLSQDFLAYLNLYPLKEVIFNVND